MPNRPVRDEWENPRKMERHFPIKPGQPIGMALATFYSFFSKRTGWSKSNRNKWTTSAGKPKTNRAILIPTEISGVLIWLPEAGRNRFISQSNHVLWCIFAPLSVCLPPNYSTTSDHVNNFPIVWHPNWDPWFGCQRRGEPLHQQIKWCLVMPNCNSSVLEH